MKAERGWLTIEVMGGMALLFTVIGLLLTGSIDTGNSYLVAQTIKRAGEALAQEVMVQGCPTQSGLRAAQAVLTAGGLTAASATFATTAGGTNLPEGTFITVTETYPWTISGNVFGGTKTIRYSTTVISGYVPGIVPAEACLPW